MRINGASTEKRSFRNAEYFTYSWPRTYSLRALARPSRHLPRNASLPETIKRHIVVPSSFRDITRVFQRYSNEPKLE